MRISELPQPLKSLAEKRRAEGWINQESDAIELAFCWEETPEGLRFWNNVDLGKFKEAMKELK